MKRRRERDAQAEREAASAAAAADGASWHNAGSSLSDAPPWAAGPARAKAKVAAVPRRLAVMPAVATPAAPEEERWNPAAGTLDTSSGSEQLSWPADWQADLPAESPAESPAASPAASLAASPAASPAAMSRRLPATPKVACVAGPIGQRRSARVPENAGNHASCEEPGGEAGVGASAAASVASHPHTPLRTLPLPDPPRLIFQSYGRVSPVPHATREAMMNGWADCEGLAREFSDASSHRCSGQNGFVQLSVVTSPGAANVIRETARRIVAVLEWVRPGQLVTWGIR